ncbi:hypothetical protein [Derxia lacustris]|uniref:hypothetical protein n=1 Tax=Derxia lacustris TaxID=764842 RepID=UPI00111C7EC8|nr:hypothetical protein [Derxia lacustris]
MNSLKRYDPVVFDHKTAFMQRIADYVRLGYCYWQLTEVRVERAWALAQKFRRLYEVHLHRNQRARARANGEGSAYALWWQQHADSLVVCLLVTPGSHAAHRLERLRDAAEKNGRIALGDYELRRHQRPGARGPSWTWALSAEAYEGWRARVIGDVRRGIPADDITAELVRMPGFAGVRAQVKALNALVTGEHVRRGGSAGQLTRRRIAYVQRTANRGKRLSTLHCVSTATPAAIAKPTVTSA